ncbi:dihydrodipicolinate synthase family protein [Bryobacter aggregatus]|uniref:dihydrodipicolinate synthase family protein n=1 Tax=Bryobacter aggregatus TaxID=360054 RepID=UPI0004E1018F|nr:dihydrodipicolinate synthase family protein [Bryobacter aggregatus]
MENSKQSWRQKLAQGVVIPAHPLALTEGRKLDERHQRALSRYYRDSGAGGIAVAVHTTQFEIREPSIGLFEPVLALAAQEAGDMIRIAGVCGKTAQATKEARIAADLGYHAGLLSLAAMRGASVEELIVHCRAVAEVIPVLGFYLQPAVGGIELPVEFWRRFAQIENVVGIKIAPFNRYATLDVVRGVAESGRAHEVALYTGNDDHIVLDLLGANRIVGGLLGHWSVWTRKAVELLHSIHAAKGADRGWFETADQVTDMNAALFDVRNHFHGCIAGIHEILRRQGLLRGRWCLNPNEDLSPGQAEELDRVCHAYPHLIDDAFVKENLDRWLAD